MSLLMSLQIRARKTVTSGHSVQGMVLSILCAAGKSTESLYGVPGDCLSLVDKPNKNGWGRLQECTTGAPPACFLYVSLFLCFSLASSCAFLRCVVSLDLSLYLSALSLFLFFKNAPQLVIRRFWRTTKSSIEKITRLMKPT